MIGVASFHEIIKMRVWYIHSGDLIIFIINWSLFFTFQLQFLVIRMTSL